jgi:hydroxymethylglutaryl-CoA lyase
MAVWQSFGIRPTKVWIGDPMSWNTPRAVESTLVRVLERFPWVRDIHLHLHNGRGMAPLSAYAAMRTLSSEHTLIIDTSIGGMGGCPYCGNGRATRMIPTEDFVHLLEAEGYDTGIHLTRLIEAAHLAEEIVGHELYGHVSKAGPRPGGSMDMPLGDDEQGSAPPTQPITMSRAHDPEGHQAHQSDRNPQSEGVRTLGCARAARR